MAKKRRTKSTGMVSPLVRQTTLTIVPVALFFLMICFSVVDTAKGIAMVMIVLTVIVGLLRHAVLRDRLGLPLIFLVLIVAMGCISTAYAVSGKFALREVLKLVIALCGALLLLSAPGKDTAPGRKIAGILEGSTALISLFSVDQISTRALSSPFLAFLGRFSEGYQNLAGVENGVRITSILDNPNIFAGCAGIGVLLALSLVLSSEGKKERRVHLCCLYINCVAFVLAFSMGAIAAIVAAFVVYLLLEHRERRGGLLVLMVETLVLVLLAVVPISMTALNGWDGVQPVPLLCLAAGAVLLCLADKFVGCRLAEKLRNRGKLFLIIVVAILALAAAFAAIAYHWTGDVTLAPGDSLRRSVYLASGEYTVTARGGDGVRVTVESQNQQDTMMHTSTVIYEGELSQAAFTVPEDSRVVYLNFNAEQGAHLEQVQCVGGGETVSVPLEYKLLPDFIANRLQGLFANQNAIQRTVFFSDGLKLFRESPVIGLGLGAFESSIFRVQSFFYETKYVHNHYIQTLLETGVVGLVLFVGLLALSAVAILRSRKKGTFHPLTPALGALLVFMAIHGAVEVVFSSNFYLPLAFGVFALINLCCGDAIPVGWLKRKLRMGIVLVTLAFLVVFAALLGNNMRAYDLVVRQTTLNSMERAISMDKFEWEDYAVSYVLSSARTDASPEIQSKAEEYARRLAGSGSRKVPYYLAQYYLELGQMELGMQYAERCARANASSSAEWNGLFAMLAAYEDDSAEYRAGIAALTAYMEEWNGENMGEIQLDENARALVDRVLAQL